MRRDDQRGFTVVELLVAMTLMMAIVPILGPMMVSSMRTGNELRAHSATLDELRVQLGAVARELRSAECIFEPAENQSGSVLRFTTNANGAAYEVKYEVVDGELIRTRDGESRVVGAHLVGSAAPFEQIANPRRTIDVELWVQTSDGHSPKQVSTSIAGRNAWRTC